MKKRLDSVDGLLDRPESTPSTVEFLHRFRLLKVPAEDHQDLVEKIYSRFCKDVDMERSRVIRNPTGYILSITRRLVSDYFHRRHSGDVPIDGKVAPVESPNNLECEVDAQREVHRAFWALSGYERELVLFTLRGDSYAEIAKRVGLSPDASQT